MKPWVILCAVFLAGCNTGSAPGGKLEVPAMGDSPGVVFTQGENQETPSSVKHTRKSTAGLVVTPDTPVQIIHRFTGADGQPQEETYSISVPEPVEVTSRSTETVDAAFGSHREDNSREILARAKGAWPMTAAGLGIAVIGGVVGFFIIKYPSVGWFCVALGGAVAVGAQFFAALEPKFIFGLAALALVLTLITCGLVVFAYHRGNEDNAKEFLTSFVKK